MNVPTRTPPGIAASSEGEARAGSPSASPAGTATGTGSAGSSDTTSASGSLPTTASWAPAVRSLYDVRRQRRSRSRENEAASRSSNRSSGGDHDTGIPSAERSTEMHPGSAPSAIAPKRSIAASSVGENAPASAIAPSSPRKNTSRPRGEKRQSFVPAHHTTAWWRARVSATYISSRSSPRCSVIERARCARYDGPSSPTSTLRSSPESGSWKLTGSPLRVTGDGGQRDGRETNRETKP